MPVVLRVDVVHVLREVGDVEVGERVGVGGAEEKVRPVRVTDSGGGQIDGSSGSTAAGAYARDSRAGGAEAVAATVR